MNRDSVDWRGYIPAITTPFTEQGRLDLQSLRRLLVWLADEGMHGLVVAGTTGEWFSMESGEKAALFKTVGEVLKGELPLIAGCNAFTADTAIANAVTAAESGFDGILLDSATVRQAERAGSACVLRRCRQGQSLADLRLQLAAGHQHRPHSQNAGAAGGPRERGRDKEFHRRRAAFSRCDARAE